ncbi:MAG: glutamine synthetase, partial [Eggerthellaceae bacterium]|nr:glutamine synthetase [Eggerthellaceae bacterium]
MDNTTRYVAKQIEERDIRFLRLWFSDLCGNLKSFAVVASDIEDAFEEGIGFDGSSVQGVGATKNGPDLLVVPDANTFQVLPWRPQDNAVARMFCNIVT